jgi:hypothetical protein
MMRPLLLLLLAGCPRRYDGDCMEDTDCGGGAVCARNAECLPASEIRAVRVTWTIRGMDANATTCAPTPNFYLLFASTQVNDTFGYEPVPCAAGLFTVDKLPLRFISVEIGIEDWFQESKAFDAQGNVAFDLAP